VTVLNTGSNKKFAAGWDSIFSGGKKKPAPQSTAKPADAKKKPGKKSKKK